MPLLHISYLSSAASPTRGARAHANQARITRKSFAHGEHRSLKKKKKRRREHYGDRIAAVLCPISARGRSHVGSPDRYVVCHEARKRPHVHARKNHAIFIVRFLVNYYYEYIGCESDRLGTNHPYSALKSCLKANIRGTMADFSVWQHCPTCPPWFFSKPCSLSKWRWFTILPLSALSCQKYIYV